MDGNAWQHLYNFGITAKILNSQIDDTAGCALERDWRVATMSSVCQMTWRLCSDNHQTWQGDKIQLVSFQKPGYSTQTQNLGDKKTQMR